MANGCGPQPELPKLNWLGICMFNGMAVETCGAAPGYAPYAAGARGLDIADGGALGGANMLAPLT